MNEGAVVRAKGIPETRDRRQSLWLSVGVGALLALCCGETLRYGSTVYGFGTVMPCMVISAVFAFAAWGLKAATPAAAAFGGMICLLLTFWTASAESRPFASALSPLIVLFVLTFLATLAGRRRNVSTGLAERRRGRETAQVIANLGAGGLFATWFGGAREIVQVLALAALAEATADTVSSEAGQAFGSEPWLLTTWRRVPAGTDGAVTLLGTAAGVAAAGVVTAAGGWAMHPGVAGLAVAFCAGCAGLVFDSLLGATVERKGWLGNDLVNFSSTLLSIGVAWCLLKLL